MLQVFEGLHADSQACAGCSEVSLFVCASALVRSLQRLETNDLRLQRMRQGYPEMVGGWLTADVSASEGDADQAGGDHSRHLPPQILPGGR